MLSVALIGAILQSPGLYDPVEAEAATPVIRVAGPDRYSTAVDIAKLAFPGFKYVTHVVIASGEDRAAPDGLAAAGLCGTFDAPLLLVQSNRIPATVRSAIASIPNDVTVLVVGGRVSVAPAVFSELRSMRNVKAVERIAGSDRYATARAIANRMIKEHLAREYPYPPSDMALLANGADPNTFTDALALSVAAATWNSPILLLERDRIPADTQAALRELALTYRVIGGGPRTVSDRVQRTLGAERWYGPDRYATAAAIAKEMHWNTSYVGIAASVPDALTGGASIGHMNGVLLLTQRTRLPGPTADVVRARIADVDACFLFGGTKSLDEQVAAQVRGILKSETEAGPLASLEVRASWGSVTTINAGRVYVNATCTDSNGRPIEGATVRVDWNYKGAVTTKSVSTGADGVASTSNKYSLNDLRYGDVVSVYVTVEKNGVVRMGSSSVRVWWN